MTLLKYSSKSPFLASFFAKNKKYTQLIYFNILHSFGMLEIQAPNPLKQTDFSHFSQGF